METTTYARPELLQVADTVARDKGIDKDEVLEAMEQAIQKAGRSKYGQEYDIRAEIDRDFVRGEPGHQIQCGNFHRSAARHMAGEGK